MALTKDQYPSEPEQYITAGTCSDRLPKAECLFDSMRRMELLKGHLESVLDRIRGSESACDPNVKVPHAYTTLQSILNDGPEYMSNLYSQLDNLIDQLEQELF